MYSIVYKTYKNDLEWLKYSLLSVNKFITDSNYEIVIYYHDECEKDIKSMLSDITLKNNYRLIPVEYDINGYLKQMVVKCMCFKDIQNDYILIMDCDVILNNFFSYKDMFSEDGKIHWYSLKRTTENNNDDQWVVWQESVLNMTNEKMDVFYMYNGFPFLFKNETLKLANDKFIELNGLDYNEFCKNSLKNKNVGTTDSITGSNGKFRIMATIFEEFEFLGWFSSKFTNDYDFIEGPNRLNIRKQFWSHGGLDESIENEIKKILL
jgi:hypothetical protein